MAAILNVTAAGKKAELLDFLAKTKENDPIARGHLTHLGKMIAAAAEQRNIVEHSLPNGVGYLDGKFFVGPYKGTIFKRNRTGKIVAYKATKSDVRWVLSDLNRTYRYAAAIKVAQHRHELFASLGRVVI